MILWRLCRSILFTRNSMSYPALTFYDLWLLKVTLFICFQLCWVFVLHGLFSPVAMSEGTLWLWCSGFSLLWHVMLWTPGSTAHGFWQVKDKLSKPHCLWYFWASYMTTPPIPHCSSYDERKEPSAFHVGAGSTKFPAWHTLSTFLFSPVKSPNYPNWMKSGN